MSVEDVGRQKAFESVEWNKRFWVLSFSLIVLRLFLSLYLDLTPDEAYYWELARHLDFSYFDHPPMVAYCIGFFRLFLGDTALAVRLPSILGALAVSWFLFDIGRKFLHSGKIGFWSSVIFNFTPAGMAIGFITTPDSPLAFSWALGAWAFLSALNSREYFWWVITGVALGTGALAKYNMIFFVPGVAITILGFKKNRELVFTGRFWVMVGLAAVGTLPILYWNANHDWISFKFQFNHGFKPSSRGLLKNIGEFLGGQLGTIGLTLFPVLWYVSISRIKETFKKLDEARFFLIVLALPKMLFFVYMGTKSKVEANWPQIAYLSAMILVAEWIIVSNKRIKWVVLPSALLAMLVIFQALTVILPVPVKSDISSRLHGWTEMGQKLQQIDSQFSKKAYFVGQGAPLAALLGFYGKISPERVAEIHKGGNFRFWWENRKLEPGSTIVYVDTDKFSEAMAYADKFEKVASQSMDVFYNAKKLKRLNITIMENSLNEFEFK